MYRGLASREAVAGSFFESADAFAQGLSASCDRWRFFNFRDEGGADDGSIGETAKNRNMAGKRNAEADGDGKLSGAARPPKKGGEIVEENILRADDSSAGYEIKKT